MFVLVHGMEIVDSNSMAVLLTTLDPRILSKKWTKLGEIWMFHQVGR